MKYLLLFLVSLPVCAAFETSAIESVRSIDHSADETMVTFWGNNRVFRLSPDHASVPCIENAAKAAKQVVVSIDTRGGHIKDCKIFSGVLPGALQRVKKPSPTKIDGHDVSTLL